MAQPHEGGFTPEQLQHLAEQAAAVQIPPEERHFKAFEKYEVVVGEGIVSLLLWVPLPKQILVANFPTAIAAQIGNKMAAPSVHLPGGNGAAG